MSMKASQCQCWQVLNNFTTFYISHQIFFFVFVVLFMLHPVPSLSHVKGLLTWLPIPYSWVCTLSVTSQIKPLPGF